MSKKKWVVDLTSVERNELNGLIGKGRSSAMKILKARVLLKADQGNRRIPDKDMLHREVTAWQAHRNQHNASADWQFKTDDARTKLKSLYPVI